MLFVQTHYLFLTWLWRGRNSSLDARRSRGEPNRRASHDEASNRKELSKRRLSRAGFSVLRYHKGGFVKGYLSVIGRHPAADGATLIMLGRLLGSYHLFISERA